MSYYLKDIVESTMTGINMQTSELGACTSQSENVNVLGTFADMRTFKNLVRDSDFFDPISPTACRQTGPSCASIAAINYLSKSGNWRWITLGSKWFFMSILLQNTIETISSCSLKSELYKNIERQVLTENILRRDRQESVFLSQEDDTILTKFDYLKTFADKLQETQRNIADSYEEAKEKVMNIVPIGFYDSATTARIFNYNLAYETRIYFGGNILDHLKHINTRYNGGVISLQLVVDIHKYVRPSVITSYFNTFPAYLRLLSSSAHALSWYRHDGTIYVCDSNFDYTCTHVTVKCNVHD